MCGIVGVLGAEYRKIVDLNNSIMHRGPDANRTLEIDEYKLALGHTRLSIIDLDERSNQPFISACKNYYIVFNGEIYNYQELAGILEAIGYTFATSSDTEVLLYWLKEYGKEGINQLDGMFSFAFYDRRDNRLLLARDHIGEKPLYYACNKGEFAFCSEISPLLQLKWIDKRLNRSALKNYLFFLYSPPPDTLYNGIKEVLPGQALSLDVNSMNMEFYHYFILEDEIERVEESRSEDMAAFKKCFHKAVLSRLKADVEVGMFLSGGLDSNAIVAQARELLGTRFHSFTVSYSNSREAGEYDESHIAKKCADYYGIENTAVQITLDSDLDEKLERTIKIFGHPFGNATSLVSDILSKVVAEDRKVCLVGDGGDEVLAGYPRYKALKYIQKAYKFPRFLRRLAYNLVKILPENSIGATRIRRIRQFLEATDMSLQDAYLSWLGYNSMERISEAMKYNEGMSFYNYLRGLFDKFSYDPLKAASLVDFKSFVPFNLMQAADRTSMQHGLELRSPFLAKNLVISMLSRKSANKLSPKYNKPLLVEALKNILPGNLLNLPKRPFNPPLRDLIKTNKDKVSSLLCGDASLLPMIIDRSFIIKEVTDFYEGRRDNSTYLWGLCTLEKWLRINYPTGIDVV